jgi:hypothetical protein
MVRLFKDSSSYSQKETRLFWGWMDAKCPKVMKYYSDVCLGRRTLSLVMRIKTNSQTVEEPKDPETCTIFAIYRSFATPEQTEALRKRYLAEDELERSKEELFKFNAQLTPLRERYNELISHQII